MPDWIERLRLIDKQDTTQMIPFMLVNAGFPAAQRFPVVLSAFVPIDEIDFVAAGHQSQNPWNAQTAFELFVRCTGILARFGEGLWVYDDSHGAIMR